MVEVVGEITLIDNFQEYFVQYDKINKDVYIYKKVVHIFDVKVVRYSIPKHILNNVLIYVQDHVQTIDELVSNCEDSFTKKELKVNTVALVSELQEFLSNLEEEG